MHHATDRIQRIISISDGHAVCPIKCVHTRARSAQRASAGTEEKAAALTDGPLAPANLLSVAEALSVLSALAAVAVFGAQLAATGSLPSAVPIDGGACWS